jgi:hypothetical protein
MRAAKARTGGVWGQQAASGIGWASGNARRDRLLESCQIYTRELLKAFSRIQCCSAVV